MGDLLTAPEVAEILRVHPSWVYHHSDLLKPVRLGEGPRAKLRFRRSAIDEFINGQDEATSITDTAPTPVGRRKR